MTPDLPGRAPRPRPTENTGPVPVAGHHPGPGPGAGPHLVPGAATGTGQGPAPVPPVTGNDPAPGPPAAPAPDLLRLDHVTKRYRASAGPPAVDGVSLRVAPGETVALVGESGSGKSTLARLALGLLAPDRGTVRFAGHDPYRLRGRTGRGVRARLQFVPQQPRGSLNPALRAGDAVAFALRVHGVPRRERPDRVAELFRQAGLDPVLARRYPRELSGGQVQRVAVARALATAPELVVCDEPTSALDTTVQAQVLDLLTGLQERLGLAYLFISHDLAVVRHLAHRVLVLRGGRVVEEGATAAVWDTPGHPYTRALLAADGHTPPPAAGPGLAPEPHPPVPTPTTPRKP